MEIFLSSLCVSHNLTLSIKCSFDQCLRKQPITNLSYINNSVFIYYLIVFFTFWQFELIFFYLIIRYKAWVET